MDEPVAKVVQTGEPVLRAIESTIYRTRLGAMRKSRALNSCERQTRAGRFSNSSIVTPREPLLRRRASRSRSPFGVRQNEAQHAGSNSGHGPRAFGRRFRLPETRSWFRASQGRPPPRHRGCSHRWHSRGAVHAMSDAAKRFCARAGFAECPVDPMMTMITLAEVEKNLSRANASRRSYSGSDLRCTPSGHRCTRRKRPVCCSIRAIRNVSPDRPPLAAVELIRDGKQTAEWICR